jgi:hypothetical protein
MEITAADWEIIRRIFREGFASSFKLYGTVGEQRDATPDELERFQRRVRSLRFLRGHGLLWGKLRTVRDVRFHAFEPVRIAPLGDPWPPRVPAP